MYDQECLNDSQFNKTEIDLLVLTSHYSFYTRLRETAIL